MLPSGRGSQTAYPAGNSAGDWMKAIVDYDGELLEACAPAAATPAAVAAAAVLISNGDVMDMDVD